MVFKQKDLDHSLYHTCGQSQTHGLESHAKISEEKTTLFKRHYSQPDTKKQFPIRQCQR